MLYHKYIYYCGNLCCIFNNSVSVVLFFPDGRFRHTSKEWRQFTLSHQKQAKHSQIWFKSKPCKICCLSIHWNYREMPQWSSQVWNYYMLSSEGKLYNCFTFFFIKFDNEFQLVFGGEEHEFIIFEEKPFLIRCKIPICF